MRTQVFIIVCCLMMVACEQRIKSGKEQTSISVTQRMGSQPDPGFTRAFEPREFKFPEDHGAHPDFATEWWYFTGNLHSSEGTQFGYQLTLFRIGLKPGKTVADSSWRSHQISMGHLAVSDIKNRLHVSDERFARSAAGLSGVENQPLKVWLGSWSVKGSGNELFPLQLKADTGHITINLTLQGGAKHLVLQGDRGLSRKGSKPGNASYYYSYTRLPTHGDIQTGNKNYQMEGNSWFDHEWSSSALADDQQGWDWFSLQLNDGSDLMFYRMRDKKGQAQIFSNGVLLLTDGTVHDLSLDNVHLKATKWWKSQDSTNYPVGWQLQIPEFRINLNIDAFFEDQEMRHTVRYWEGAVVVSGSHSGVGYLELTGYDR